MISLRPKVRSHWGRFRPPVAGFDAWYTAFGFDDLLMLDLHTIRQIHDNNWARISYDPRERELTIAAHGGYRRHVGYFLTQARRRGAGRQTTRKVEERWRSFLADLIAAQERRARRWSC